MKRIKLLFATTLLACLSVVFALTGADDQTILQGLQASPDQFSTFVAMLEDAGLTDTLQGPGPVTVLAPTNSAFDDMDAATLDAMQSNPVELAQVLNGLILQGAYSMLDLKDAGGGILAPLSGEPYDVDVTAGGLTVNGVGFQATDVDNVFSNGVVHVTDTVIMPLSLRPLDTDSSTPETTQADGTGVPVVPPVGTAPATQPDATPASPATEEVTTAFVRVVQLSPATTVHADLSPHEDGLSALDFGGLEYGHATDYQEVQAGKYLINAQLPNSDGALFDAPSDTFRAGRYYTIAITGLQVPVETDASTDGEGFGGWLRNLFGSGDAKKDALAMKATTYEDEVRPDATDSRVRVIDAAPGSPAFDIVTLDAAGERHVLAGNMVYGDDSGAKKLADDITGLQLTAADSAAVALELQDALPLASDSTIYLIGTTFEGAPYEALVLPNGPSALMGTNYRY